MGLSNGNKNYPERRRATLRAGEHPNSSENYPMESRATQEDMRTGATKFQLREG